MKQAFKTWVVYNIMAQILGLIAAGIGSSLLHEGFLGAWQITAIVALVGMNSTWFVLWLWCTVLEPWTKK